MISACASMPETTKLENPAAFKAASGSVVSIRENQPVMFNNQSSKAGFGALGAIANIAASKKLMEESNIIDPASSMEDSLKAYISENSQISTAVNLDYTGDKVKKPKKLPLGKADYVLDVSTLSWGMNYYPVNWVKYRTYYNSDITLFDGATGNILAQNVCSLQHPETAEESPSFNELTANNAALYKANIKILADRCVDEFKMKALGF